MIAPKSNLSLDALVEKLLDDALPVVEHEESELLAASASGSFEDVLAQIRAIPPNIDAITPATKSADELVATLEAQPPSDDLLTFEEMWPLWQNFEQDLK